MRSLTGRLCGIAGMALYIFRTSAVYEPPDGEVQVSGRGQRATGYSFLS